MSKAESQPRAIIHQNILDIAKDRPDASLEEIAAGVIGATPEIVDRVLDEYGDPGEETKESSPEENYVHENGGYPVFEDLSEPQRETLRAIHERPSATQRELGERLDVSSATINHRVNTIEGFEWEERHEFVEVVYSDAETQADGGRTERVPSNSDEATHQFGERIAQLEEQFADLFDESNRKLDDPELVHKVVHACMASDNITEDEELRILKHLI